VPCPRLPWACSVPRAVPVYDRVRVPCSRLPWACFPAKTPTLTMKTLYCLLSQKPHVLPAQLFTGAKAPCSPSTVIYWAKGPMFSQHRAQHSLLLSREAANYDSPGRSAAQPWGRIPITTLALKGRANLNNFSNHQTLALV
jgi:hypothetical protein